MKSNHLNRLGTVVKVRIIKYFAAVVGELPRAQPASAAMTFLPFSLPSIHIMGRAAGCLHPVHWGPCHEFAGPRAHLI